MSTGIVVTDTSVLLNFLKIDRMDLFGHHPDRFLVTSHVEAEIEDDEQRLRYEIACSVGHLEICTVTDVEEIALFARLNRSQRLGVGECSAIAVAVRRGYTLAIDDNKALNRAIREAGLIAANLPILRTQDVVLSLIRTGVLSVQEADDIKDVWARYHRFRLKLKSFRELLNPRK